MNRWATLHVSNLGLMAERVTDVPFMIRRKATELGDQGVRWLVDLPKLIIELEQRWSVTIGPPLPGGTEAYVGRARTRDGRDAVVKLGLPAPGFADELRTISDARGRGYVRLLDSAPDLDAMLREALDTSMSRLDQPPERTITLLCQTLRQAWDVPRPAKTVMKEKAAQLAAIVSRLWDDLDRPCPEAVIDRALDFAQRRADAFDPDRLVVVHGDPHPATLYRPEHPGRERNRGSCSWIPTDSWPTRRTTSASYCATGVRNSSRRRTRSRSPAATAGSWRRRHS